MSRIVPASRIVRVSWMSVEEDSDVPEEGLRVSTTPAADPGNAATECRS
jgi:hypothetical protein